MWAESTSQAVWLSSSLGYLFKQLLYINSFIKTHIFCMDVKYLFHAFSIWQRNFN